MTTYACETLKENAELTKENAMLKAQNRELLARCDRLEAELCRYNCELEVIVMTLEEDAVLGDHNLVPSLRAEVSALHEAVAWERECEDLVNYLNAKDSRVWLAQRFSWLRSLKAARAEVDRLLKEA